MNLNLVKRNPERLDKQAIDDVCQSMSLHPKFVELMFSRGFRDKSSIAKFLNPSLSDLHDPFLLKGMHEAVKRIQSAIDNKEKVVVYGDYDADGICASAILSLYFSSCGLDVITHIPNRIGEGYGLSIESIERIIDNACPDLIITCDCGISAKKEVRHAIELGVDIIVTDHHEISDEVPECIIINPKQTDCNYPINFLCGAGVALKVVQALGGIDEAQKYFDLASIATVADLVPLLDENRLIVQLGLMESYRKNLGLNRLCLDQGLSGEITSSDIAFKIAPRINAAGRMGDAYRAFELLTSKSIPHITSIIEEINDANNQRKKLCDELYDEAIQDIEHEDLINSRAIVLSHPNWEKGITGILAARIAGDFKRPAFILVNSGEYYKGTSRSVANVNIYELLTDISDILVEYGGHSQAAGFSIKKENIDEFKKRAAQYLEKFNDEDFLPSQEYDLEIEQDEIDLELVRELEKLEPLGNGNVRPVFLTKTDNLKIMPCKNNIQHTNITLSNGMTVLAFNYYNNNQFLLGNFEKQLALEIQLNRFCKKESVKAVLKAVSPSELYINDAVAKANYIKNVSIKKYKEPVFKEYNFDELAQLINPSIYGTMLIAGCKATYEKFKSLNIDGFFYYDFLHSTTINNLTKVMISPIFDSSLKLSNYDKIIFLDSPIGTNIISYINSKSKARVYVPSQNNEADFVSELNFSREEFKKYYEIFSQNTELITANAFSFYKNLSNKIEGLNESQFVFCLLVFNELGIISFKKNGFGISINKNEKKELNCSEIYVYLKSILG